MASDSTLLNLLGFGKARDAGENISDKQKYDRYVTRTQSEGREPKSFEEWRKDNGS